MGEKLTIRAFREEDVPFIQSSWLHSYKASSTFAKNISDDIFFKYHHALIDHILTRKSSITLIAEPKDEDVILGYICLERLTEYSLFHYIYVKRGFKGFGVCEKLISASPFPIQKGVFATHLTFKGQRLIKEYQLTYNPYLIS